MKKVLIVSSYIPPIAGGAEQVAWQIALGLRERFEIHILTVNFSDDFAADTYGLMERFRVSASTKGPRVYEELREGIMIHYVPYQYPLSVYYSTFGKKYLNELFLKNDFDLINIHLVLPWGYLLRKCPAKKVITTHSIPSYGYKKNWIISMKEKYNAKAAFSHASLVLSSSKWCAEKIEKDYGIEVQYIPNGIDLEKYYVNSSDGKQNVILFIGRYIEMKGIKYLLEAAKKLPMYEFWFIGKGPLEKIIKGENVRNFGFVDKIEGYISKATICVFPSFIEASPLVGLEAMACGKPVIATSAGFSEYIEHMKDGCIIEPESTQAIIDGINVLMKDYELRKTIGQNARKKAEQYSWNVIYDQYADLFHRIIDSDTGH